MRWIAGLAFVLAAPTSAQGVPDVVGTWELTAAENVPYENELVFARMAFSSDELRSVFVFLDPDDAELQGRIHSDRYVVSDGQFVVRDAQSTTVLDVAREGTELTVRDVQSGVLFRLREADPAWALDPDLVGAWAGQIGSEQAVVTFSPDGAARVVEADGDTETVGYVVAGPYLLIDEVAFRYAFARADGGRQLVLERNGEARIFQPTRP